MPFRAERCTGACWTSSTLVKPRLPPQSPWGSEMHQVQHQGRCGLAGLRRQPGGTWPAPPGILMPLQPKSLESRAQAASVTSLASPSGLGAEEPLSTATEDTGSPLSTGYHTRSSSSEEVATEPGASLHGSRELPAGTPTRMRTASELLLSRSGVRARWWVGHRHQPQGHPQQEGVAPPWSQAWW